MAPVKVEIPVANLVVSVDFSEEKRGLWVATTEAWYWLHDCDESQEELHQPMRAKFGLLSNLIDTLLEDDKYFETYEKLAPKLVHQKLSCLDEALFQVYKQNQANDILYFQEPFDYTLMSEQGGVTLLKQHLGGLFPGLEKSKFWKELVKQKGRKPGTAKWTPEQYRASAELAEERSQRTAWGMKLPNAKPIRPNWNMEARLDQEQYQESPKAQRQRVSKDSDDEEPARKKSKKTNKQKKNPLENDEYRRRQEVALAALEMKKEAYSDERMVESLVSIIIAKESQDPIHAILNGPLTFLVPSLISGRTEGVSHAGANERKRYMGRCRCEEIYGERRRVCKSNRNENERLGERLVERMQAIDHYSIPERMHERRQRKGREKDSCMALQGKGRSKQWSRNSRRMEA